MANFRIIPVIDILNGEAVHAKKGLRKTYEPVKTVISNSSNILDISRAFKEKLSFDEVYIADLDSIIKETPNLEILERIIEETNLKTLIDPGIRNHFDILQFKKINLNKLILATETIESLNVIDDGIKELGVKRLIISIDMKDGKLLARSSEIEKMKILDLISIIYKKGLREFIFLDLTKVGMKTGCYDDFYREVRTKFSDISILLGGGVKDYEDINFLKTHGINGVLVGTAIHDGTLNSANIKKIND